MLVRCYRILLVLPEYSRHIPWDSYRTVFINCVCHMLSLQLSSSL